MHSSLIYCINVFSKVCEHAAIKTFATAGLVSVSFLFDGALALQMQALFVLVILDFIFAIAAAHKTDGQKVESRKAIKTVYKLVLYFGLVSAANVTELALPGIFILQGIDETVIAFLALTELISVLEHAAEYGLDVPKRLLGQLKEYKSKK